MGNELDLAAIKAQAEAENAYWRPQHNDTALYFGIVVNAADFRALIAELEAVRGEAAKLRTVLAAVVGANEPDWDDECYFDHDGNCQAHFIENPCSVGEARRILAKSQGEVREN